MFGNESPEILQYRLQQFRDFPEVTARVEVRHIQPVAVAAQQSRVLVKADFEAVAAGIFLAPAEAVAQGNTAGIVMQFVLAQLLLQADVQGDERLRV